MRFCSICPHLLCVSSALRPVDSDLCLGIPPNTTQLCHISCPVECDVSAWSAWGPCTHENCQDHSAKKGRTPTPGVRKLLVLVSLLACRPSLYFSVCTPTNLFSLVSYFCIMIAQLLLVYQLQRYSCRLPISWVDMVAARLSAGLIQWLRFLRTNTC